MIVRRVHTENGSYIEPALDSAWPDLKKLQWKAAVVEADSGIRVDVIDANANARVKRFGKWIKIPGQYSVFGVSSYDFHEAWAFMTGLSIGAEHISEIVNPK